MPLISNLESFTPEQFAETFCMEMNLPKKLEALVTTQIQRQVEDYKKIRYKSSGENIFLIRVIEFLINTTVGLNIKWHYSNRSI